ncbi:MAG TPA: hypothetical protein VKU36_04360 [Candidatus Babeliales bacterium]|nr:hypothetical protein [Candidatus Babeliales bacterium]
MSSFKTILVIILTLYSSSPLMGMEKESQSPSQTSHSYFDPELQKTLALIIVKNRDNNNELNTEEKKAVLIKDILRHIANHNYNLYVNDCFKKTIKTQKDFPLVPCYHFVKLSKKFNYTHKFPFTSFWQKQLKYINSIPGKIKINDFDFITMSDEGRKVCLETALAMRHPYEESTVDEDTLANSKKEKKDYFSYRDYNGILTKDGYNKALILPIKIKSGMGILPSVKTVGEEHIDFWSNFKSTCDILGGGCLGVLASQKLKNLKIIDHVPIPLTLAMITAGVSYGVWSHDKQKEYDIFPTPMAFLHLFSGNSSTITALIRGKKTFKVENKPLITLEEREIIKKAENEAKEKIESLSRENLQKTFEPLRTELKKETKFTHMLLKNRE